MSEQEMLAALERMSNAERLRVIEVATRLVRSDLGLPSGHSPHDNLGERMRAAAEMMRDDYAACGDLTAFSALDSEDFYDA